MTFLRKLFFRFILPLALLLAIVVQIGLYGANGGLLTFLEGQSDQGPFLNQPDVASKPAGQTHHNSIGIETNKVVAQTAPEFLSFALDISQVVGGKWWNPTGKQKESGSGTLHAPVFDFNRPILDTLVKGLLPAYLRIGGSESDKVYYAVNDSLQAGTKYESELKMQQWDNLNAFVGRTGLKFMFTLNAGPSARNENAEWLPKNAEELMKYSAEKGYNVDIWELGNELNLFWYIYGPSVQLKTEQYDKDIDLAETLVKNYFPQAQFAGQGSAIWPVLGEPLTAFFGFAEDYIQTSGSKSDLISFHYYPQQSRRGPIASRRAYPGRMLNPDNLNEIEHWYKKHATWRNNYAAGKPIWIGETGNAQFGGEPGLSDVYLSGLWWLDQLGLMAKNGAAVMVRQTLSGMTYGMIENETLTPRTDYWNSFLWKKLMGNQVLALTLNENNSDKLRAYCHKANPETGMQYAVLLINLDHEKNQNVIFMNNNFAEAQVFELNADDILGNQVKLNGFKLALNNGSLPKLNAKSLNQTDLEKGITINPLSYSFVLLK